LSTGIRGLLVLCLLHMHVISTSYANVQLLTKSGMSTTTIRFLFKVLLKL